MIFCIITQVPHLTTADGRIWSYAPYVREMNMWLQHADTVILVAPQLKDATPDALHLPYEHHHMDWVIVPALAWHRAPIAVQSTLNLPMVGLRILQSMRKSAHIHLRCPGNMGLLGLFLQRFFPHTPKTVKYAGNWVSNDRQPWSYRLQKKLLRSPFWMVNAQVLVYTFSPQEPPHIVSSFGPSYSQHQRSLAVPQRSTNRMYLLFVGSLHPGKQPNQLLQLTAQLRHSGMDAHCYVAGQGPLEAALISQAESLQATDAEHWIHFLGGLDAEQLQAYYQRCHFMVLPSQSEGWPKAVAEAMWWGCVPVVPPISCVSDMLDGGQRGVIMTDLSTTTDALVALWKNPEQYHHMAQSAQQWSQAFTIERFAEGVAAFMQAPH